MIQRNKGMPDVTIYYLEMMAPEFLNAKTDARGLEVIEAEIKQYQFNRFLYQFVGKPWQWTDKLSLTNEQWQDYAENDNLRTWVAYYKGAIAGYYELHKQDDTTEIAYFGLAQKFIGKGFGGYLLSHAIQSAWGWGNTNRVCVNSCTKDHPSAIKNYIARGMKIYRQETAA